MGIYEVAIKNVKGIMLHAAHGEFKAYKLFLQVAHRDKIAVGGHSYGAFMTANLLAHAPHLFCCGIARSGAYNRTLTPFVKRT